MLHCHQMGVVHRDLKVSQLFIITCWFYFAFSLFSCFEELNYMQMYIKIKSVFKRSNLNLFKVYFI